jgi:hypothetical protein
MEIKSKMWDGHLARQPSKRFTHFVKDYLENKVDKGDNWP